MAHVFMTMGTAVSVDLPAEPANTSVNDQIVALIKDCFDRLDRRFSLYREDSELSLLARGETSLINSSDALRDSYALALDWRRDTDGAFTPHRPDGIIDLSGVVKAQAMLSAKTILEVHGLSDWCINAGGDVLVSGATATGAPWRAGIVDPHNRQAILTTADLRGDMVAMATSGSAERGDHIWLAPGASRDFAQVSVVAHDILTADVLATAIISGGLPSLNDATDRFPIDVFAVLTTGELLATPGFMRDSSEQNFGR